ncbi:MAG: RagB/SusD family nutrient uptake outer membrane protein [Tannerella sp.]|nr:RagB/SusD family nutrient uptake outer membrane protein [Tannerella sp.]
MKKITFISIMISLLAMTSCSDFLEIRPVGKVDATALQNNEGIDMTIVGMYAWLYTMNYSNFGAPLSNYQYGDVMGGQANKGSSYADQSTFTQLELYDITTDNGYLQSKWAAVYNGIARANNLMSQAEATKDELSAIQGESKDKYTETMAQAYFMRAFWHFEGIKVFGAAIPYIGSEEFAKATDPQVSNVDESGNYIYIWDKVIADAKKAFDDLPNSWSSTPGYVNKWAAAGLMGKIYVYYSSPYNGKNGTSNHWNDALSTLKQVIDNGVDGKGQKYKLADTYNDLYTAGIADWTGESVFDIQHAISGTQTATNAINGSPHIGMVGKLGQGGWGFYQPSYDMANSYIVDDKGLPLLDKSYRNKTPLSSLEEGTTSIHTDLTVYTDPRIDYSIGRFETPYLDYSVPLTIDGWIREYSNGGPYLNKKNIPNNADRGSLTVSTSAGSSAKNFHLIRYADILLMYAEALIETGAHQEAGKYINQVRARAANAYVHAADFETMEPSSSQYVLDDLVNGKKGADAAGNYRIGLYPDSQFATKDGALAALRFERQIELGLEGHRWFDLARWGIAYDELTGFLAFEQKYLFKYQGRIYPNNLYTLPIPNNQIKTMAGLLVQNPDWK